MTSMTARSNMARTIAACLMKLAVIDNVMQALLKQHVAPARLTSKAKGPIFQATNLTLFPELEARKQKQIAKLAGVAPMNLDGGQVHRKPRVRSCLPGNTVGCTLETNPEHALSATACLPEGASC